MSENNSKTALSRFGKIKTALRPKLLSRLCISFPAFCAVAALSVFLLIMLYLSFASLIETVDMNMNNSMLENVEFFKDSFLLSLLALVLFFAVCALYIWLMRKVNIYIPMIASAAFIIVFGVIWVFSAQSAPTHDSLIVSNAALSASQGDYSRITANYFKQFPFQLGYVLWSEGIIRLFNTGDNYLVIEVINVICLAVSAFALMMSAKKLFGNKDVVKLLALLFVLCIQPILFCTFTYGNIPGLMFASLAVWHFSEIRKGIPGWIHAVLCALAIGISITLKKNFMIVFAAIAIIGLLKAIKHKRLCDLVCVLLCAVSFFGMGRAVENHYEKRIGNDFDFGKGIPMVSWLSMGLNESYIAPGWYNGIYTVTNFHTAQMDPDAAAESSLEVIKERLEIFSDDKRYARDFFGKKITSQWNEPTYQSLWTNQVRGHYGDSGKLASAVLGEKEASVKNYMNLFQQFIFVMTAVAAFLLIRRREIDLTLLPTVIVGGFIYHALFEAKSQYAIVYFVLMLPLAAYAACELYRATANRIHLKNTLKSNASSEQ